MLTIQGLYEIYGQNLAMDRKSMMDRGYIGLGPDDLISLTKEESGFFFSTKTSHFYHFTNGFNLDSPAIFCAYFSDIIRQQQKSKKNNDFKITKGRLFSYNSFSKRDVVITAYNPGQCESKTIDDNFEEIPVNDEIWKQLRISSLLRFFRGSQPLQSSLFETNWTDTPALISQPGGKLTIEDFKYIVQYHEVSNDLQTALSFALLCSLSFSKINVFIQQNYIKYPQLLSKILNLIPKKTVFGKYVYQNLVEPIYQMVPDDVETAIQLTSYYLDHDNLNKSLSYTSLLKASIVSNPKSGCCLSRICVAQKNYYDSLIFLNVVGNVLTNMGISIPVFAQKYKISRPPNTIQYGPIIYESQLLDSPISGPTYLFFTEIARLINSIGEEEFMKMIQKMNSKSNNQIQQNIPTQFSSDQLKNTKKKAKVKDINKNDCLYLYDPGIECDKLSAGEFKNIPFSDFLYKTSLQVIKSIKLRNDILEGLQKQSNLSQILLLGYKLCDKKLIEFAIKNIDEKTASVSYLNEIILMKLSIDGQFKVLEKIPKIKGLEKNSFLQGNAFPLIASLYKAIQKNNLSFQKKEELNSQS
ncbi:bud site selection protein [Tritrichomonas musculus]|uniref:Bud site selection protein n=1 Tax=Tritrichomonas musculus TaxID=1915356 RepID=A0ABR2HWF8_9EUKA